MSAIVRQRARLARVRRIQHNFAAAKAARARGEVAMLETSADRLSSLRLDLGADAGETSGATLASRGELAMRLDAARAGLGRTIAGARAVAVATEDKRLVAYRDQESAERLGQRAVAAEARRAERRTLPPRRPRGTLRDDGDWQ